MMFSSIDFAGRKLFSFWIVWPHDKRSKPQQNANDSTEVSTHHHSTHNIDAESEDEDTHNIRHKDLKQIVQSEMALQKSQQQKVEEQLENHKTHDSNVRLGDFTTLYYFMEYQNVIPHLGAKVAAVAVGGVVIGALTAGIGLIPYMTVVGITAVAGGGAVAMQMQLRGRPSDTRLYYY